MHSISLRMLALPLCLSLAACANEPSESDSTASGSESSSSTAGSDATVASTGDAVDGGSEDSSTSGEPAPVPIDLDRAWVEQIEGLWVGPMETVYFDIPEFPLDFAWQPDGRLHANVSDGKETSFDFDFVYDGEHWLFVERGVLPGGTVQGYTLHPIAIEGDRVRWTYLGEPGLLVVDLEVNAERLSMDVSVRGIEHASLAHTRG